MQHVLKALVVSALASLVFAAASEAAAQMRIEDVLNRFEGPIKVDGALTADSPRVGGNGERFCGYSYTAAAGEKVTISLASGRFNPYVRIGRMDGHEFKSLWSQSADRPADTIKVDFTFPEAGKYVILASSNDHDALGAYTLKIEAYKAPGIMPWFTVPAISFDGPAPPAGEMKWFNFEARNRLMFTGVWGADSRTIYVASSAGIHQSDDGGATWRQTLVGGDDTASHQKNQMKDVWGRAKDDVYAVGSTIQHTSNGGKTWQYLAVAETSAMKGGLGSVWGRGDHVYVVGTYPTLLQSADRGATWTLIPSITTSGDKVTGNDEAVFILTYGALWSSADEGKTWNKVSDLKEKLERIWGVSDDLYGIGEDGVLVHHVRGGGWKKLKAPAKSMQDIWGVSPMEFFIAGTTPKTIEHAIFHTRDGGKTWTTAILKDRPWRLWGVSADDVWVGGAPGIFHGLTAAGFAAEQVPAPLVTTTSHAPAAP